jgi:hypothetical protein
MRAPGRRSAVTRTQVWRRFYFSSSLLLKTRCRKTDAVVSAVNFQTRAASATVKKLSIDARVRRHFVAERFSHCSSA